MPSKTKEEIRVKYIDSICTPSKELDISKLGNLKVREFLRYLARECNIDCDLIIVAKRKHIDRDHQCRSKLNTRTLHFLKCNSEVKSYSFDSLEEMFKFKYKSYENKSVQS